MPAKPPPDAEWYITAEVAELFSVERKAPNRWAKEGRFPAGTVIRTPGGDLRFRGDYIRSLLNGGDAA